MADFTLTPNMGLILPTPGVDPGPDYADQQNASTSLVDAHDHSPGKGVLITPSGLNISADLPFGGNNATTLRSVRLSPQSATLAGALDVGAVYNVNGNLYYNNGAGTAVQITNGGSVVGASGNITGLVSPASATYVAVSSAFVWQSAVNTSAAMDSGPLTIRNLTASSNGITFSPPVTLPASYQLTWPSALPASTKVLQVDSSGNVSTADNTAPGSSSTGTFSTTSTSLTLVTSVPVVSTGRPIIISLQSDGNGTNAARFGSTTINAQYDLRRDGTSISLNRSDSGVGGPTFTFIDQAPPTGSRTYALYVATGNAANPFLVSYCKLVAVPQ